MDDETSALRLVNDALGQREFTRDWTRSTNRVWRGTFSITGNVYPISITINDLNFVDLPEITILDRSALPRKPITHIMTGGRICYLDATTTVLDRYNPAGTVLYCLERAEKVLAGSIAGKLEEDFAAEFASYWRGTAYVDLPDDFAGDRAQIYWVALDDERPEKRLGVIARANGVADALLLKHRKLAGNTKPDSEPCICLRLDTALTVVPGAWPPRNLARLAEWLGHFINDPWDVLNFVLTLRGRKVLVLRATNGYFVAEVVVPAAYDKDEFRNRPQNMPRVLAAVATIVPVERFAGYRIDAAFIFGRNMQGMKNLAGKKIAVVGCGTIGGFLAHALAESGAGALGGELHLIDRQILQTANLGRHILGTPYLDKAKAEALRSFLIEQLPHVAVKAHIANAADRMEWLLGFDLIIDATGEEALSLALNHFFLARRPSAPPILFVYLAGNGAAAQALMCIERQLACLKCLKPVLGGAERFPLLREQALIVHNLPCDEGSYIPFPVSRSMQAAGLAVEMALDWVNNRPRPYLRTLTLDEGKAYRVKDQSPDVSQQCPERHPA